MLKRGLILALTLVLIGGCDGKDEDAGHSILPDVKDGGYVDVSKSRPTVQKFSSALMAAAAMERDRRIDRKAIVKSFTSRNGEPIVCIPLERQRILREKPELLEDFRKVRQALKRNPQPAFDTPQPLAGEEFADNGFSPGDCPEDTYGDVDFTLEQLAAQLAHERPAYNYPPTEGPNPIDGRYHRYAVARNFLPVTIQESVLNIWDPPTDNSSESSISQIWMARGNVSDNTRETIEVGWKRGAWESYVRMFIGRSHNNYNPYIGTASAYVQTVSGCPTCGFSATSTPGGTQKIITVRIERRTDGKWWILFGGVAQGYMYASWFATTGLRNQGDYVTYGGEVATIDSGGTYSATDMGSGLDPAEYPSSGWFGWIAYQRGAKWFNSQVGAWGHLVDGAVIVTDPYCYNFRWDDMYTNIFGGGQSAFFFGGGGLNNWTWCN